MLLSQIYEALAKNLNNGLNVISEIVKFDIKYSYNVQEPSKGFEIIKGIMNFSDSDIAPIENLNAYTLPAIVTCYPVKEYASEVTAILTQYVDGMRGLVQQAGEYFAVPTFSTPSQGEITQIGQLGEVIPVTLFVEYAVYKGLFFTNNMKVTLDGESLLFNNFGIGKQRACDSDSLNNYQTVHNVVQAQTSTFNFNVFMTTNLAFLMDEILSLDELEKQHTLSITMNGNTSEYTVVMTDAEVNGAQGGAMYASLYFGIVRQ